MPLENSALMPDNLHKSSVKPGETCSTYHNKIYATKIQAPSIKLLNNKLLLFYNKKILTNNKTDDMIGLYFRIKLEEEFS